MSAERCAFRVKNATESTIARQNADKWRLVALASALAEHAAAHGCRALAPVHALAGEPTPVCVSRGRSLAGKVALEQAVDAVAAAGEVTCPRCLALLAKYPQIRNALVAKRAAS